MTNFFDAILFGMVAWIVCLALCVLTAPITNSLTRGRFSLVKALAWSAVLCLIVSMLGLTVSGAQSYFGSANTSFAESLGALGVGTAVLFLLQITGKVPHCFS